MGPSDSARTTLLHLLAGILRPTAGSVDLAGRDLGSMSDPTRTRLRRSDFGFVFQSGQLLSELPADENTALPLVLGGQSRAAATARARELLARSGLAGMEHRRPGELSGGQAQRVAIARALVGPPSVVFADEPTGALDQGTGREVLELLTSATRASGAALVVTHDAVLHAARSRETWIPLVVTTGGATLLALLVVSPVLGLLGSAPAGVAWFVGCALFGAVLVLLAARASRPLVAAAARSAPTGIPSP
jgi:putative ABC transport system ATP-binding protein